MFHVEQGDLTALYSHTSRDKKTVVEGQDGDDAEGEEVFRDFIKVHG